MQKHFCNLLCFLRFPNQIEYRINSLYLSAVKTLWRAWCCTFAHFWNWIDNSKKVSTREISWNPLFFVLKPSGPMAWENKDRCSETNGSNGSYHQASHASETTPKAHPNPKFAALKCSVFLRPQLNTPEVWWTQLDETTFEPGSSKSYSTR